VAANPYSFNLYSLPDFDNNTAFVNLSETALQWLTPSLGLLTDVQAGQFDNIGGALTIDSEYLDMHWLALDGSNSPSAAIGWGGQNLYDVNNIDGTGDITMVGSGTDQEVNIQSTNPFGVTSVDLLNSAGNEVSMAKLGPGIPTTFSNGYGFGGNTSGVISRDTTDNANLILASSGNNSIIFGNTPDGVTQNITFGMAYDPTIQGLSFLGSKLIRPVAQSGGFGLFFQSQDALAAGQFPFAFTARTAADDSVALSWMQNGKNNSFSGQMNSFGLVPKDWVDFGAIANDSAGIEFLTNRSNYINFCKWQQSRGFISEGCKYFADTSGQGGGLLFAHNLEIHDSGVIHGGLTTYNNLDYITRNDNDMNVIGADIHARKEQIVTGNFTNSTQTICNFDAGLCNFVSESIAPEVGRDWQSVNEIECHSDACANAKGGNLKVMCEDRNYTNLENINVSFWLTTNVQGGDSFVITLDNNLGTSGTVFTEAVTVDDEFNSFLFPSAYENQGNVTMCVEFDGSNVVRQSWLDELMYFADLITPGIINQTEQQGAIWLGEDGDDPDKCGVEVFFETNETTQQVQKVLEVGCPTGTTRILGAVEQVDVTIIDQNITGNSIITGNLTVGDTITQNGSTLDETYFRLDGDSVMAGNANFGGYDLDDVGNINQNDAVANVDTTNEVWVPNNYEGIQRWMETSVFGMGLRYNALANKLYIDRYNNNAVPTVVMTFDRATGNVDITDSLNIGDNLDVEDDLNVSGLIYGNGSQLTGLPETDLTGYAKYQFEDNNFNGSGGFYDDGEYNFFKNIFSTSRRKSIGHNFLKCGNECS
jgi:hypothetical protein